MASWTRTKNTLSYKLQCYIRISLRKNNNTHENVIIFLVCLIWQISCRDVTHLLSRSVILMNERGSLHHFQPKVVCQNFSDYGWLNTEKFILLKDSDIQNFLEKEENQNAQRKTEGYILSGFGKGISCGYNNFIAFLWDLTQCSPSRQHATFDLLMSSRYV